MTEPKEAVQARSARIKQAKRDAGLVPLELWVKPEEKDSIREKFDRSKEVEYFKAPAGKKPSSIKPLGDILFSFHRFNDNQFGSIVEPIRVIIKAIIDSKSTKLCDEDCVLIAEGSLRELFQLKNKKIDLDDKIKAFSELFYTSVFQEWFSEDSKRLKDNEEALLSGFYAYHNKLLYEKMANNTK